MDKSRFSTIKKIDSLPFEIRLVFCAGGWIVYYAILVLIRSDLHFLSVLPVILCGWLLGVKAGLIAGLMSYPVNLTASFVNGAGLPSIFVQVVTLITLSITGGAAGRIRDLRYRLTQELNRRKQFEDTLWIERDLAISMRNEPDMQKALNTLLEAAVQIEGVSCGAAYLVDPENGQLNLAGYQHLPEGLINSFSGFEAGSFQAGLAGMDKAVYRNSDTGGFNIFDVSIISDARATASLPVRRGEHSVAVLFLISNSLDSFPSTTRNLLEAGTIRLEELNARHEVEERLRRGNHERTRTEHAMQIINEELLRTVAELEQHNQEISLMNDMSGMLQSCFNPDEVYRVLVHSIKELLPEYPGALYLFHKESQTLETSVVWGGMDSSSPSFRPDACLALRRWRVYFLNDPETTVRCDHFVKMPQSYVCAPLIAQDEIYGLLYLEGRDPLMNRHYEYLIMTMTERSALMLKNLELTNTLQMQATRDSLTGLPNHRFMVEALERELGRAIRHKFSFGIVMLDLDQFKKINDTLGHGTGDLVLREVGRFLQGSIRSEDVACRYGGDEFVLILTQTTLEGCQKRAEQLRVGFKGIQIQQQDVEIKPGTISVGVAVYPEHGNTIKDLLLAADLALYQAKGNGKDQVVTAKPFEQ